MSRTGGDTRKRRKRDPERAAEAAETFAQHAAPTPLDQGPPPSLATEDGGQPTRRARYLRRRAANRSRITMGKPPLPDIGPGGCEPCSGWGTIGEAGVRCQLCMGEGG